MNSIRARKTNNATSDFKTVPAVRGAKTVFENGIRRQRAPSPAPVTMTEKLSNQAKHSGSVSSFKEVFEQFTAPRRDSTPVAGALRRAASEDNVNKEWRENGEEEGANSRGRERSNSVAEKHWIQAKTKIYEQLSGKRSQSAADLREEVKPTSTLNRKRTAASPILPRAAGDKSESSSLMDRINRYKSDVETKKTLSEKSEPNNKQNSKVKAMQSTFNSTTSIEATQKSQKKLMEFSKAPKKIISNGCNSAITKPSEIETKLGKSKVFSAAQQETKPAKAKEENKLTVSKYADRKPGNNVKNAVPPPRVETTTVVENKIGKATSHPTHTPVESLKPKEPSGTAIKERKFQTLDVVDHKTAHDFMDELIAAVDGEQRVPMKQLITLFEKMKQENGEMHASIDSLKQKLGKSELDTLSKSLENKLSDTTQQLEEARQQIGELSVFREALQESEERFVELEEMNLTYLEEIEELKIVMDEMRDQFHDDEVHETIILQQRLDDMARSLRIIHFRLKKADAKLQDTEREKEGLLDEIRLLQGGSFSEEELRKMQSLEGDLQAAKEVSVELHNELHRSEDRREKLELESMKLREEVKDHDLENDRLRNNILHLRQQVTLHTKISITLLVTVFKLFYRILYYILTIFYIQLHVV